MKLIYLIFEKDIDSLITYCNANYFNLNFVIKFSFIIELYNVGITIITTKNLLIKNDLIESIFRHLFKIKNSKESIDLLKKYITCFENELLFIFDKDSYKPIKIDSFEFLYWLYNYSLTSFNLLHKIIWKSTNLNILKYLKYCNLVYHKNVKLSFSNTSYELIQWYIENKYTIKSCLSHFYHSDLEYIKDFKEDTLPILKFYKQQNFKLDDRLLYFMFCIGNKEGVNYLIETNQFKYDSCLNQAITDENRYAIHWLQKNKVNLIK